MNKIITVPTLITCVRIIGTVLMLFAEPMTLAFIIIYAVSGVSDALDGFIARATNTETKIGTVLDSIADLFFYSVMLIKIFPILYECLPKWIWYAAGAAIAVRISAYIFAAIKYRRFSSRHTYLNKLTGFMLFVVPCLLSTGALVGYCAVGCAVAILSSGEELVIHIIDKNYDQSIKTLFRINKKERTNA